MRRLITIIGVVLFVHTGSAQQRYAVTGMVVKIEPERLAFVASIDRIPGFMAPMTMPFEVREKKELSGLVPGAVVEFTLVVNQNASYAEGVRIRRYESLEQDPLTARRLEVFKRITAGDQTKAVAIGESVPDFTLTDHKRRTVSLSRLRGKVVAINFMYTACRLPDFCIRVVNHFGTVQKRFKERLGRELILLTITFDPARDQPDVLDRYARQWKPDPDAWRFLTGSVADVRRVVAIFGVSAFPDEGQMDHSLRTAVLDREGRLVASIEGNQYSPGQLGDLIQSVLEAR